MNYREKFRIRPGHRVRLKHWDPSFSDPKLTKKTAAARVESLRRRMDELQFKLYAERKRSLLICLQARDAGGKDGVIRHVLGSMNPLGCRAVSFGPPSAEEAAHDFLWRVERQAPKRGEVVIFNRSHYEGVLVERVHKLVPRKVWSRRYKEINDFERRLAADGTHIVKCFLHISKEEQLERFGKRLDDPGRRWKISEDDYTDRELWPEFTEAYEDALSACSTHHAPWFIVPADHKWFRDLVVSEIIVHLLEKLRIQVPKPTVNLEKIRQKYHRAENAG